MGNAIPPPPPSTLSAVAVSVSEITLSWSDNSSDEQGFKIERKSGNGMYQEIATVNPNVVSYKDVGLTKKTAYTYRVYSFNKGGRSTTYTNEATATTFEEVPAGATNLIATAVSTSQIDLRWDDKSTNELGFKIERKLKDGAYSLITSIGENANSYSDKNLTPNTLYTYRIYPYNSSGNASFSNEASDTTFPDLINGLVAFYPLDGNGNDVTKTYDASIKGTINFVANRNGVPNSAMQGENGYLQASTEVFQFKYDQSCTVSFWFTTNGPTMGRILSTENPEGNFRVAYYHEEGKLAAQFGAYFLVPVTNSQWTHLVWTNENGNERIYLNGQLAATHTETAFETLNYGAPFTIGAKSSGVSLWNGKIDDVGIWKRILNEDEIRYLFKQ